MNAALIEREKKSKSFTIKQTLVLSFVWLIQIKMYFSILI